MFQGGSDYGPHFYSITPPGFSTLGAPPGFGAPSVLFNFGVPGHQFLDCALAPPSIVWDQNALTVAFNTTSLTPLPLAEWYMDSDANSHITSTSCNLLSSQPPSPSTPSSIVVGKGSLLPITSTGHTFFPTHNHPLHLSHILVAPHIIKNLISVHQFTTNNQVSIEFDLYGLSVKYLHMRNVIVRCNNSRWLYPLFPPMSSPSLALLAGASTSMLWHHQLGHLSFEALYRLVPSCNKLELETLCHACQLGRHIWLPFSTSRSCATKNFDLIHCDLWTSHVLSVSSYKYYLVILDDCSNYLWTFPLHLKSDTFQTLSNFFAYVKTQFSCTIKSIRYDNEHEFDSSTARNFSFVTASPYASHAPILLLRTGMLSMLFAPLMTLCVVLCFRPVFLPLTG
jgi:hypothetical protein